MRKKNVKTHFFVLFFKGGLGLPMNVALGKGGV
jgi:hypothetical protein